MFPRPSLWDTPWPSLERVSAVRSKRVPAVRSERVPVVRSEGRFGGSVRGRRISSSRVPYDTPPRAVHLSPSPLRNFTGNTVWVRVWMESKSERSLREAILISPRIVRDAVVRSRTSIHRKPGVHPSDGLTRVRSPTTVSDNPSPKPVLDSMDAAVSERSRVAIELVGPNRDRTRWTPIRIRCNGLVGDRDGYTGNPVFVGPAPDGLRSRVIHRKPGVCH